MVHCNGEQTQDPSMAAPCEREMTSCYGLPVPDGKEMAQPGGIWMAGKEPIVSVIVPVYNTQSWLAKCLNSLLNQTLREIEIILVDDGSTDYSAAICGAFAESDSRIRFYQQENRGVSAARNLGLQYARGKYVMFCDSDDFVGEDYCRLGAWYAERYPDAMVDMGRAFVDAKDEIVEQQFWDRENTYSLLGAEDMLGYFQKGFGLSIFSIVYDRKLLEEKSIRFDENLDYGEDTLFSLVYRKYTLRCLLNGVSSAQYYYRHLTRDSLSTRFLGINYFYTWRRNFHLLRGFVSLEDDGEYLRWMWKVVGLSSIYYLFDPRNPQVLEEKLECCQQIVSSEEFQDCCFAAVTEGETDPFLAALRQGDFYKAYPYMKLPQG